MSAGIIRLEESQGSIRVNPIGYLGDSFQSYLAIVRRLGASYDRVNKCNYLGIAKTLDAIRELSVAGFEVEVDERINHSMQDVRDAERSKTDAAKQVHDAALERMDRIDAELMTRGLALYPYQRDGVRAMSHRHSFLNCDEMGLGKTIEALVSILDDSPTLVVCPAGVKGVWLRETNRWRPDLGVPTVLKGRDSFRWPRAGEVVITNYDILPSEVSTDPRTDKKLVALPNWVRKPAPGTVLIYDEVHAVKNPTAIRTKAARILTTLVHEADGYVWGLTGTPMLNRHPELWHVLLSLGYAAEEAFESRRAFNNLFDSQGRPRGDRAAKLLRICSLMRRREEVLPDLPTKTYQTIPVPIDDEIRELLDRIVQRMIDAGIDLDKISSIAELVSATKGAQLSLGEISRVRAALASAKISAALEAVERYEDEDQPLVVVSSHRLPVDTIARREGWATITGDTKGADRSQIEEDFQKGIYKGLAMTIKAGGVGITLTHAHHMLFVDKDWTPGWNSQCEDRLCRIGQDRGVQIISLVADHAMDEKVNDLLTDKAIKIDGTVNASAVDTVGEQFLDEHIEIVPVSMVRSRQESQQVHKRADRGFQLDGIKAAIDTARLSGLKRPGFKLDGIEIKQASDQSAKYRGCIHVSNGGAYGSDSNVWYGSIDTEGYFKPSGKCTELIADRLKELNEPGALQAAAMAFGIETGACCFCALELTDPRSVGVGYGPICAGRYGLPWGG